MEELYEYWQKEQVYIEAANEYYQNQLLLENPRKRARIIVNYNGKSYKLAYRHDKTRSNRAFQGID